MRLAVHLAEGRPKADALFVEADAFRIIRFEVYGPGLQGSMITRGCGYPSFIWLHCLEEAEPQPMFYLGYTDVALHVLVYIL